MGFVAEALPRRTAPRPALLDTGEPPLVELSRTPCPAPRLACPVALDQECDKQDHRQHQKQRQQPFLLAEPGNENDENEKHVPGSCQRSVTLGLMPLFL